MRRDVAMTVFDELERRREVNGSVPTYRLRLDATDTVEDQHRDFRIRVTPGPWGNNAEEWIEVMQLAHSHDVIVRIENHAVVLI